MAWLQPIFYISLLKPYRVCPRFQPLAVKELKKGSQKIKVIVAYQDYTRQLQYLIKQLKWPNKYNKWELQLIYLLPYMLQDLKRAHKLTIKLFMGVFYTDILKREQNLFINSKVFSQIMIIIVFYLKLLGIYYQHRRYLIYKVQAL